MVHPKHLKARTLACGLVAQSFLEELLPFPLQGIDVDNVGAFLNAPLEQTLFLEHMEQIEQWLAEGGEATMNAAEILRRLIRLAPGTYHEGQLRSMERRVREWRAARAEHLLGSMRSAGKEAKTEETPNPVATLIGGNN